MAQTEILETVSLDKVSDFLKAAGYRVTQTEQNGLPLLMSASQGIGFQVRFGNPTEGKDEAFRDLTFACVLRVEGALPEGVVNGWNAARRFSRLSQQGAFLVLEMDVLLLGGVTESHLHACATVWDRLLQDFLLHLRQSAAANTNVSDAPEADQATEAPVQNEAAE